MFKTSFSKYLTAFVLIIFTSFLMLSGIITSIIRTVISSETEEKLNRSVNLVADMIENADIDNLTESVDDIATVVGTIVNFDSQFDILVATTSGKIILSTAYPADTAGIKKAKIDVKEGLGVVDISAFSTESADDGGQNLVHRGTLLGVLAERSLVYASPITFDGEIRGYVMSLASMERENKLVGITRRAVINSSIWVMLAAVIAAYFITERIIQPLRSMKSATKKFAQGDFSARIAVYGHDEVAELGKAFNNMAESLDNLDKMRNSFLANISHDLRTPMTTISGFIDGITSGAIPPEKHEYYLGVISAEVHRLSRLVSQILDVSRLESGERKFNHTDFDIAEMARIILISFERKIDDKHLDVEFYAEEDEMYAFADKDAIYQVLYNLCHNATKFAKDGGKFVISISYLDSEKIKVSVFDEGESISAEDSKLVFDRFYKTDKSRGLDKSGVGLGLYICKTIIDSHGEEIGVSSVEGESSEFWFTLQVGNQLQKRKLSAESDGE